VNLKYNEFFDENSYSLPRLANGYKGDELPKLSVPVFIPKSSSSSTPPLPYSSSPSNFPSSTHPALLNKQSRSMDRQSDDDNASLVSDLTGNEGGSGRRSFQEGGKRNNSYSAGNGAGSGRRMTRKSIFDTKQLAINAGNIAGRNMLSGNMCEFIKEECVEGGEAEQVKEQSCVDPFVLLGWQV
jgi:hypothetical protein